MANSYFDVVEETPDVSRFAASGHTVGPWSRDLQHGGPPTALAVTVAARHVQEATGRRDLRACRLAADFVRAVPVGPVGVRVRIVRAARSAALAEATVDADGRECLVVRVWFVRDADTSSLVAAPPAPVTVPAAASWDADFGYGRSLEWRFVEGSMTAPGPASTWLRPLVPLVPGWPVPSLARCALVADSGSGISAELDWTRWSFVNVDLDVHLARPVEGEWLHLAATTQLGPHGSAVARSTLADVRGVVGGGLQTLVVGPLPDRADLPSS
ncbi:Thioesterase-like superfamily protein [Jatrophihabitans endophyticus]|uniref:Thioesterase-like superfamily protein n=1 Tax=Jatrophihabitans endophyticus TaxID=1206085 RepID=A0A1M5BVI6_9ACTN|nr:acyl-CoA thioesterase domain-containing protein [Jatrophihabitans endophyticus]SHF46539.1 Thioesterase-like superfamily protein [Jatrophihabitans endophyticus]